MPQDASNTSVEGLNVLSNTAVTLVRELEGVLFEISNNNEAQGKPNASASSSSAPPVASPTSPSIDSLSLAHDSATLIKAHSTKISVLIINEPFTPSAVIKVLRELVSGAIPGLSSAAQSCTADRYTLTVRRDLAWKSYIVLKELRGLLERTPKDGKALAAAEKDGSASTSYANGKGSIVATGVLWSACDEVVRFSKGGVAGCFVSKVEEFRATLQDVMEELKEWGEEEPDEDGDDDDDDDDADQTDRDSGLGSMMPSNQDMVDDIMGLHQVIPRDDPDGIRERLESCLKRLRLTTILYQAVVKRRLKVLPPLPADNSAEIVQRLNEVMGVLRKLPPRFDDLAGAFYDLDASEIDRMMDQCFFDVFALSELMMKPWDKERDEFTEWAEKFQQQIKK